MALCNNCGAEIQEGIKFCGNCGQAVEAGGSSEQGQQGFQQGAEKFAKFVQDTADETAGMDPKDIEANKVMGGLAYILFFLPLIACPDSKYGRFHANQGLVYLLLCVAAVIINTILSTIFVITIFLWFLAPIISLVVWIPVLVIGVIGLINGFTGKAKELPIVGGIKIIK